MDDQVFSVSEYVAMINQTMEYAYPVIRVEGEVSEFRISKGKWVYFNLQDDHSSVKMFGTIYQLNQPIENGMKVVVKGTPRLHNKYGFSLNLSSISPSGEGSIKKAFELLKKKLADEGLFDPARKRELPPIPARIGLVTSEQAAAYEDFLKILGQRWAGVEIVHANVQVQGEAAPAQIVKAIEYFSQNAEPVDVIVITRGGGGAEDLMAFSDERVVRAVAGSRIPTLVGVGHEIDVSLADLAADVRATTPTNAAQLVVPNKQEVISGIGYQLASIGEQITSQVNAQKSAALNMANKLERVLVESARRLQLINSYLSSHVDLVIERAEAGLVLLKSRLDSSNPKTILAKGYSLATDATGKVVSSASQVRMGDKLMIQLAKGKIETEVKNVR